MLPCSKWPSIALIPLFPALFPMHFYHRMSRAEPCLCEQITALFSIFSGSPFPAWSSTVPQTPLALLFSCKWECRFSVVIPNDKEVCTLNTLTQNPQISAKCPLNVVRKYGEESDVCVNQPRERGVIKRRCRCWVSGAESTCGFWQSHQPGRKNTLYFNVHNDFTSFGKAQNTC